MVSVDSRELRSLAGLLGQPGQGSLAALSDLMVLYPGCEAGVREIEGISLEAWQEEHTRLFVNGIPRTVCPPFASAWSQQRMGGEVSLRIAEQYRRAGLRTADGLLPDYLGTLLEFSAYLLERGHESVADDGASDATSEHGSREDKFDVFRRRHLIPWVPDFAETLVRESRLMLYRYLGERLAVLFPKAP